MPGSKPNTENDEAQFRKLLSHPEQYSSDEFEALIAWFRPRMSYELIEHLTIVRLKKCKCGSELERKAAIAVLEGRYEEFRRLEAIMKRRNALGLRVAGADNPE